MARKIRVSAAKGTKVVKPVVSNKAAARVKPAMADLTSKRTVVTAPAKPVAQRSAFVHFKAGFSPYTGVSGVVNGALLLAATVVAGFATLSKDTLKPSKGGGSKPLFVALIGGSAWNHHKSQGRIDGDRGCLTAAGAEFFSLRMDNSAPARNTDAETVAKVVAAMTKGGAVEGLKFTRKVTA